jgi:hypothetical protein
MARCGASSNHSTGTGLVQLVMRDVNPETRVPARLRPCCWDPIPLKVWSATTANCSRTLYIYQNLPDVYFLGFCPFIPVHCVSRHVIGSSSRLPHALRTCHIPGQRPDPANNDRMRRTPPILELATVFGCQAKINPTRLPIRIGHITQARHSNRTGSEGSPW